MGNVVLMRAALTFALVLVTGYGILEVRRWFLPATQSLLSLKQKRLRTWGFVFLLTALSLWLGGTYLPEPQTKVQLLHALLYWMVTVLCVVPIIPLALLDSRENLRRLQQERRRLLEETLQSSPSKPS